MSTRSRIAIKNQDESYDSIYVHWDGDNHFDILKQFYSIEDQVRELIKLGDLSVLGKKIGTKTNFDTFSGQEQCLAYDRDRGDQDVEAIHSPHYSDLINLSGNCNAEFLYIFEKRKGWKQILIDV